VAREQLIALGLLLVFAAHFVGWIGVYRFSANGYEFVTVHGTSMAPTLTNGQTVVINHNLPEGNLTNRILVFGDARICHRCLADEGNWLTFQGDNSSSIERASRDEVKAIFVQVSTNTLLDSVLLGLQ
jgi:hypothetical protein